MRELTERRFLRAATRGRPLSGAIFAVTALLGTAGWAQAQSADLVLAQQVVSPDPVPAGGVATITMSLQNNGPDAASGVKLGDTIPVKVILIDDQGRIKLSRKAALREANPPKPQQ